MWLRARLVRASGSVSNENRAVEDGFVGLTWTSSSLSLIGRELIDSHLPAP